MNLRAHLVRRPDRDGRLASGGQLAHQSIEDLAHAVLASGTRCTDGSLVPNIYRVLHIMAIVQLRHDTPGRAYTDAASPRARPRWKPSGR
ncbi:hypothetical protein [Micromonospora sp. KC606]|uniref:hypothetical protein n=1 Tax=Micromonospora sp. KC606 TaxID=2530379 RepID=UPI001A9F1B09|nr:hypothetical protein [Micromonospora sp. KC606]